MLDRFVFYVRVLLHASEACVDLLSSRPMAQKHGVPQLSSNH